MYNNIKIDHEYLKLIENNYNVLDYFGNWTSDIENLNKLFINAEPYEHIIIPNFLNENYAEDIYNKFPTDFETDNWHKYMNPIEVKYANDYINELDDSLRNFFYLLSTDKIINIINKISNIPDLQYDPYLHGAGIHAHPRNGRLNMHLDYEKHPYLDKQRRLNIILYISKDWDDNWNGQTELWDKEMLNCVIKSSVRFNTAIIFKTNDISWHGLPEIITCPKDVYRKSLAYYYISNIVSNKDDNKIGNDGSGYRTKATFVKRPSDPYNEKIEQLYKIRPYRRIEKEDIEKIYPEWILDDI